MVEADQRFWHPFTAFGMAEEMVSHLLCQVDEAGCILGKQNELVQESPKKGYGPKGGCHLSGGCVARNLRGMLEACNPTFLFSLDSHSKQAGDECHLLQAVAFFDAIDLT